MSEVPETSTIRRKKIKEKHDGELCLMQLTVEKHAIVYNLQVENRYEVAMLYEFEEYRDPLKFSMTGFELCTPAKQYATNSTFSLGFQRGARASWDLCLMRAFAEIDLHQVHFIRQQIRLKGSLSKADLGEIEPESTLKLYEGETFLSLFAE